MKANCPCSQIFEIFKSDYLYTGKIRKQVYCFVTIIAADIQNPDIGFTGKNPSQNRELILSEQSVLYG